MKRAFGIPVPEGLGEFCCPERCALIIYDMQAGIVPQIDDGKRIVEGCGVLLEAARRAGVRVFFTRHLFLPELKLWNGTAPPKYDLAEEDGPRGNKASDHPGFGSLADCVRIGATRG